jgi:hypothetical protein
MDPLPERVVNRDPIPADASIITLVSRSDRVLFTVSCHEYNTRDPGLTDNERLDLALGVTPGALASKSERLGPYGSDEPYFYHPYCLEVSDANVLALTAAGLAWTPDARSIAQKFSVGDEDVRRIKALMLEHFAAQVRAQLSKLVRAGVDRKSPEFHWPALMLEHALRELG